MIKKLRFKFILISLFSIFVVLASIIAAINIHNYYKVEQNSNTVLTQIIAQGFDNPGPPGGDPLGPPPLRAPGEDGPKDDEKNDRLMAEHYFLIAFNSDNTIYKQDFSHIFSLSDTECTSLAFETLNKNLTKGKYNQYRFLVQEKDGYKYVAFVDQYLKLEEAKTFLVSSLIISSIGYVVIGALIVGASFFVFKTSEESYKKQKQFITNASHELKTPLTIISTDVELVEMDNGKSEWTESIKDQVERLTKMTNQLVTLSKIDEQDFKNFPKEDFSISELALQCLDTFSPSFAKENLDLKYLVEPNVSYSGNKGAIDELLHIFLENALKYTKDKGSVFALLKKEKSRVVFSIKNDVKDASKIDPDQLFDRFYRSPDTGKSGSGIGLSIAKEIIRIHKGDVKVNLENNQLEFVIIL